MNDRETQRMFNALPLFEQALNLPTLSIREQSLCCAILREAKAFLNWVRREQPQASSEMELLALYAELPGAAEIVFRTLSALDASQVFIFFISHNEFDTLPDSMMDSQFGFFRHFEIGEWEALWNEVCLDHSVLGNPKDLVVPLAVLLMTVMGFTLDEVVNIRYSDFRLEQAFSNSTVVRCLGKTFLLPTHGRIMDILEKSLAYRINTQCLHVKGEVANPRIITPAFIPAMRRRNYSGEWLWHLISSAGISSHIKTIHPLMFRLTFFRAWYVSNSYYRSLSLSIDKTMTRIDAAQQVFPSSAMGRG